MIIEGLEGFEHKFSYSIVGHSGANACVPLVEYGCPPADRGAKLEVVQKLYGYAGGSVRCETNGFHMDGFPLFTSCPARLVAMSILRHSYCCRRCPCAR
jgi:hypothetical protein